MYVCMYHIMYYIIKLPKWLEHRPDKRFDSLVVVAVVQETYPHYTSLSYLAVKVGPGVNWVNGPPNYNINGYLVLTA